RRLSRFRPAYPRPPTRSRRIPRAKRDATSDWRTEPGKLHGAGEFLRPCVEAQGRARHISSLCGAYSLRKMRRTLVAVLAIGLLAACAGLNAPAASKSETPQQSLAATGKEMTKLKSVRFDAKATVSLTL